MQTRTYSPDPVLKRPGIFFRDMWVDVLASRELAVALAKRDIKALYRQSMLGYFWAFLPPLAATAVFLFLRSGGAVEMADTDIPYPAFVLIGTLLWQIFVDSLNGPLKVVTSSRAMIIKINFPREALIMAGVGITLFNFCVRLIIMVPALAYFYWKYPESLYATASLALFPLGVFAIILLGYTFGVLLTPIGMLYKDVQSSLILIVGFWMFLTPVAFPLGSKGSLLSWIQHINPVSPVIETTRDWLYGQTPDMLPWFFGVLALSFVFVLIGWIIYRVSLPHVIARLGM